MIDFFFCFFRIWNFSICFSWSERVFQECGIAYLQADFWLSPISWRSEKGLLKSYLWWVIFLGILSLTSSGAYSWMIEWAMFSSCRYLISLIFRTLYFLKSGSLCSFALEPYDSEALNHDIKSIPGGNDFPMLLEPTKDSLKEIDL